MLEAGAGLWKPRGRAYLLQYGVVKTWIGVSKMKRGRQLREKMSFRWGDKNKRNKDFQVCGYKKFGIQCQMVAESVGAGDK